ncbi:MAG TPA: LacI family DNA-binding transcriptional regulator, partial [Thermomicrobiales bacterium]|nr:LacI family DNA-binding transcriptional regulator [Thermomicrobiales bacterium]
MGYSKKQSVTLQTLADRLGVSRTTISNAFNKPDQLTAELRERILSMATELGYSGPDPMAKSLRSGKSGAFGLILSGSLAYIMADPAAQQLVLGIAEVFDESADSLWILPSTLDRSSDVRRATEAVVDGFIIHCLPDDDPRIGPILARNLPIVSMHGPLIPGIPFVGSEDRIGAMTVANHICELGHRRIGVISLHLVDDGWNGPITEERLARSTNLTARERVDGMRTVLQEHGLAWSQVLSHECADFGFEA